MKTEAIIRSLDHQVVDDYHTGHKLGKIVLRYVAFVDSEPTHDTEYLNKKLLEAFYEGLKELLKKEELFNMKPFDTLYKEET